MGKKGANPAAMKEETIFEVFSEDGKVLTMIEVDPADENPALLDAIRYVRRGGSKCCLGGAQDPG